MGFEDEMRQIIALLPKDRQTMLFSATQSNKARSWLMQACHPSASAVPGQARLRRGWRPEIGTFVGGTSRAKHQARLVALGSDAGA